MSFKRPQILASVSLPELFNLIFKHSLETATAIICCDRNTFLQQLWSSSIDQREARNGDTELQEQGGSSDKQFSLTNPTIGLIADSSRVSLVFCPTVQHLRAYLASIQLGPLYSASNQGRPLPALFVIVNAINLHRNTSDLSAQGFSRTIASIVDTAASTGKEFWIIECTSNVEDGNVHVDVWQEQIPLLSAIEQSGNHGERLVTLKSLAEKWCVVTKNQ